MTTTSNSSIAIQTLVDAASSIEQGGIAAELSVMKDAAGNNLNIVTANGCTATAYRDTHDNVIITFQGTTSGVQLALDQPLASGKPVSTLAGFADALAFASKVESAAIADGVNPDSIYITGHSLGGSLAEYVAQRTGLAGASFAGSGLGGNANPHPASNFVSFVGLGDPFANEATDTAEAPYVQVVTSQMDHVGEVALVGDNDDSATLTRFNSAASAMGISVATNPIAALTASGSAFSDAWSTHAIAVYAAQITSKYGDATLAQIAALNRSDSAYGSDTGADSSGTVFTVYNEPLSTAFLDLNGNDAEKVVFGGNAALDLIAGRTTIVLNGANQNGIVTIDSLGDNTVWMGTASVDYMSGGHTLFVLGDANNVSGMVNVHDGDSGASNEFLVWGDASETQTIQTDGAASSIVFGGASNLDFNGGNATIILNGLGQTGNATIDSRGGNIIWSGSASLTVREGDGNDTILLDGASTTSVVGAAGLETGLTHIENIANTGDFTYDGGLKTAQLDLGSGQNSVFGGSAAQTITMNGTGTLTVTDSATATGVQSIRVANAGLFTFLGGGNEASVTLGAGRALVHAGSGNTTLTGGAGNASIDLSNAVNTVIALNGATSGAIDIFGYNPGTAKVNIADVTSASVNGGSLVVSLADHATVTFHGFTDVGQAGIVSG